MTIIRQEIDKADDYSNYNWTDENGNLADSDLIKWLCENNHETKFNSNVRRTL